MGRVLVHLTTGLEWRSVLHAGSIVAEPFVHLSTPDQVALPANRLFAGRTDMLLLVLDAGRLGSEVRWEPGVPTDPESMTFPHLYGPLPVAAVTAVVPYRPGSDGGYVEPAALPDGPEARARWFDRGLAERRAAVVLPVEGGTAVLDPRVSHSYEHNSLWFGTEVPTAATIRAEADRVLAGYQHRRVVADGPLPAELGWDVNELRVLILAPDAEVPADAAGVVSVTRDVMNRLWAPQWRRTVPGLTDVGLEHLLRREGIADAHVAITDLAVLGADGAPIASCQLRIDGATAAIEAVMTDPSHQRQGHGTAVVTAAARRARSAGCDVVFLCADAADWPRRWYERLGFVDIGPRWEASRT